MTLLRIVRKSEQLNYPTDPIVKWIGGKRSLLHDLLKNLPTSYNRYFEPFIGGGALFFKLLPKNAYIADSNWELINVYITVRDHVDELIEDLGKHENTPDYYSKIKNLDRVPEYNQLSNVMKASRFIYLIQTSFNGLYRVNSKGQFNSAFGYYKDPKIIDEVNLRNCSKLLQTVEINCSFFVSKSDGVYEFSGVNILLPITSFFIRVIIISKKSPEMHF